MAANGNDVSAFAQALVTLFTSLSSEQVEQFMGQIHAMAAISQVPVASTVNQARFAGTDNRTSAGVGKIASGAGKAAKAPKEGKKLRPLNSFMAFRSYYSSLFPDIPQKLKSGFIKVLWHNDQFQAKWAILAKAYSEIRDTYTTQVSLDTFLALCAPFIGVIPPTQYLSAMNWNVSGSGSGISLAYGNVANCGFNQALLTTNLSAADLVEYCHTSGYVKSDGSKKGSASCSIMELRPALVFAAQPLPIPLVAAASPANVSAQENTMTPVDPALGPASGPAIAQSVGSVMDTVEELVAETVPEVGDRVALPMLDNEFDQMLTFNLQAFLNEPSSSPNKQFLIQTKQIAHEQEDLNDVFIPGMGNDSFFHWDPYTAQDRFEPFDISQCEISHEFDDGFDDVFNN